MANKINDYDLGNISDMLGGIKYDIESVKSMVKIITYTISGEQLGIVVDKLGIVNIDKKDLVNVLEIIQSNLNKMEKNISELQDIKEIAKLNYKGGN